MFKKRDLRGGKRARAQLSVGKSNLLKSQQQALNNSSVR